MSMTSEIIVEITIRQRAGHISYYRASLSYDYAGYRASEAVTSDAIIERSIEVPATVRTHGAKLARARPRLAVPRYLYFAQRASVNQNTPATPHSQPTKAVTPAPHP
jgi:hypothetical protein